MQKIGSAKTLKLRWLLSYQKHTISTQTLISDLKEMVIGLAPLFGAS